MKTILVSGGNSGIGLQATREFVAQGHKVIILGRDMKKGEDALSSLGEARKRASFLSVDLSTHDGVRDAAQRVLADDGQLDAVLHTAGVFPWNDIRTADGLNLFFAVNYLSRYHLTQLLLPALRRSERGRVVMMTAKVNLAARVDPQMFPKFEPFVFRHARVPIQIANHHYAAYLRRTEPGLLAGVANAGSAKTDILRLSPWYVRAVGAVAGPLFFNSVEESAYNVVQACLRDDWPAATYWEKPGDFDRRTAIALDESVTHRIMEASREITGA
jgi:NAD(P)-dependent dehydrogenase (short-subunit alcohol dehydrogenase family)